MPPEEQIFYGKTLAEALAWRLVWLMAPELGVGTFMVTPTPPAEADTLPTSATAPRTWVPIKQPFAIGDRVIVIANEHYRRETLNLIGCMGKVRGVYPSPTDRIRDCDVLLDGETEPRGFPPSALARLDSEADDWDDDD